MKLANVFRPPNTLLTYCEDSASRGRDQVSTISAANEIVKYVVLDNDVCRKLLVVLSVKSTRTCPDEGAGIGRSAVEGGRWNSYHASF